MRGETGMYCNGAFPPSDITPVLGLKLQTFVFPSLRTDPRRTIELTNVVLS